MTSTISLKNFAGKPDQRTKGFSQVGFELLVEGVPDNRDR